MLGRFLEEFEHLPPPRQRFGRKSSGHSSESRSFLLNCYKQRCSVEEEQEKAETRKLHRRCSNTAEKGRHPLRVDNSSQLFERAKFYRWPSIVAILPVSRDTCSFAKKEDNSLESQEARGSDPSIFERRRISRKEEISSLGGSFRLATPPLPFSILSPLTEVESIIKFLQNFVKHRLLAERDPARYKDWWPSFVPQQDLVYDSTHRRKTEGETME